MGKREQILKAKTQADADMCWNEVHTGNYPAAYKKRCALAFKRASLRFVKTTPPILKAEVATKGTPTANGNGSVAPRTEKRQKSSKGNPQPV